MANDPAETLPLPQRLALSYAAAAARPAILALLLLDGRLAAIVAGGGEPAIAQIKLAWWRERLSQNPALWPQGEPLLASLRDWPGDSAMLAGMADGWEMLLADRLDTAAIMQYAQGRAQGWAALGHAFGVPDAESMARQWALADLLLHLGPGDEAQSVRACLEREPHSAARLPRSLRPLSVLHGLAMRAVRRSGGGGAGEVLDGPGALLLALRLGITGR